MPNISVARLARFHLASFHPQAFGQLAAPLGCLGVTIEAAVFALDLPDQFDTAQAGIEDESFSAKPEGQVEHPQERFPVLVHVNCLGRIAS